MAAQERHQPNAHVEDQEETPVDPPSADPNPPAGSSQTQGVDDLLDEIDGVLESNAEEFVRGFIQKGGQ